MNYPVDDPLGLVGTTVADRYEVVDVVGEGGFSVVYRAIHRIWNQPVALKCFTILTRAPDHLRETLIETFVQEGKLMAELSGETASIVQARDIGSLRLPDGRWIPYLVLEWLDGRPLSDMLDDEAERGETPRDLAGALDLLAGPIEALACAHRRGVAHLDVKPDNLFVCADGSRTKVLDFGVAKVLDANAEAQSDTVSREISTCSPNYAAPEQFDHAIAPTGPRTDVYGLALVLLEILRGGDPPCSGTLEELARRSRDPQSRPTPRALGLVVSDAVEQVFARALMVHPDDRYPSAGEFHMSLRTSLDQGEHSPSVARMRASTGSARFGRPDALRPTGSMGELDEVDPTSSPSMASNEALVFAPGDDPDTGGSSRRWWVLAGVIAAIGLAAIGLVSRENDHTQTTVGSPASNGAASAGPHDSPVALPEQEAPTRPVESAPLEAPVEAPVASDGGSPVAGSDGPEDPLSEPAGEQSNEGRGASPLLAEPEAVKAKPRRAAKRKPRARVRRAGKSGAKSRPASTPSGIEANPYKSSG